jgi:hypothetical protein
VNRHEAQSCRRCNVRPRRGPRAVSVITVITSVWDIPRLCECEWLAPDYGKGHRAWTRTPDPSCPYHAMRAPAGAR